MLHILHTLHVCVYIYVCMYSYVCRFFRGHMSLVIDGKCSFSNLYFLIFLTTPPKQENIKIKRIFIVLNRWEIHSLGMYNQTDVLSASVSLQTIWHSLTSLACFPYLLNINIYGQLHIYSRKGKGYVKQSPINMYM